MTLNKEDIYICFRNVCYLLSREKKPDDLLDFYFEQFTSNKLSAEQATLQSKFAVLIYEVFESELLKSIPDEADKWRENLKAWNLKQREEKVYQIDIDAKGLSPELKEALEFKEALEKTKKEISKDEPYLWSGIDNQGNYVVRKSNGGKSLAKLINSHYKGEF